MSYGCYNHRGVHVLLSEHGGEREKRHEAMWNQMKRELDEAVKSIVTKYEEIVSWDEHSEEESANP